MFGKSPAEVNSEEVDEVNTDSEHELDNSNNSDSDSSNSSINLSNLDSISINSDSDLSLSSCDMYEINYCCIKDYPVQVNCIEMLDGTLDNYIEKVDNNIPETEGTKSLLA